MPGCPIRVPPARYRRHPEAVCKGRRPLRSRQRTCPNRSWAASPPGGALPDATARLRSLPLRLSQGWCTPRQEWHGSSWHRPAPGWSARPLRPRARQYAPTSNSRSGRRRHTRRVRMSASARPHGYCPARYVPPQGSPARTRRSQAACPHSSASVPRAGSRLPRHSRNSPARWLSLRRHAPRKRPWCPTESARRAWHKPRVTGLPVLHPCRPRFRPSFPPR